MKKTLLLILICTLLLSMSSCGKSNDKTTANDSLSKSGDSAGKADSAAQTATEGDTSSGTDLSKTSSAEKNVENTMKRLINATDGVKIESLTVMDTKNASDPNTYKVYAVVTWSRKHSPSDSQETIQTYSDNIASAADTKLGNVAELCLMWLVPNFNGTASITYENTDGMLALKEGTFDSSFGGSADGTTGSGLNSSGSALNTTVTQSAITN
ncbi:hypothetical protein [Aminipila terrae]|uniref:DUF5067 domain-containing protein n=1 Tax=Aminipila terrae TaxID=2697030 RepID=A0A6P1MK38_9FIRM|nr:hypothetical protein [Aminipila terrae]QHI71996.1 hypothetical protein Ami3637_05930 [Aminipila terrae]